MSRKTVEIQTLDSLDTFGGRLAHLLTDIKGYDLKKGVPEMRRILNDMQGQGLLVGYDLTDKKTFDALSTAIKRHLLTEKITSSIEVFYFDLYMDFFGCSADYLLLRIDSPTYDEKILKTRSKAKLTDLTINELTKSDSDKLLLYNRIISGGYIDTLISGINAYFDMGASVQIRGEKISDKNTIKEFEKAVQNIKTKILCDSGADFIRALSHDSKIYKHFMTSSLDLYYKKVKKIHKDSPLALKAFEDNFPEFKADMLSICDKIKE